MPVNNTIKMRRGTASQWQSANSVLSAGEMGFESDTRKFKFGNGTSAWNIMPYASAGGVEAGGFFVAETAPVGANVGDIWYNISDAGAEGGKSFIYYEGYWVELNPGTLGPQGSTGAAGPVNTLTVGTVTTLAAGELATVEITGTAPNQTVNFGVPNGADGATGDTGIVTSASAPANTDVLWVDTSESATVESTLVGGTAGYTAVSNGASGLSYQPVSVNYIINGGFDVWQRGTSISVAGQAYGADRWKTDNAGTSTVSRQTTGAPEGSRYLMRVLIDVVSNSYYGLESCDAKLLAGKPFVLRALLRRNSTFSGGLSFGLAKSSSIDANPSGSGWTQINNVAVTNSDLPTGITSADWYVATVTGTVPSDGTAESLRIFIGQTVGESSGAYYEVAEVQLEAGSIATPFKRNAPNLQGELAACQRYYFSTSSLAASGSNPAGVSIGSGSYYTSTHFYAAVHFPTTMRARPTFTRTNPSGTTVYSAGSSLVASDMGLNGAGKDAAIIVIYTQARTAGDGGWAEANGNGSTINFSAEL